MAAGSQSSSAAVVVRRAGSHRAGPLAGWAWCAARQAMQFGKRQGARSVEFRPNNVRFFLPGNPGLPSNRRGQQGGPTRPACQAAPSRCRATSSADSTDPPAVLSKRKQRSQQRLLLWQHRQKVRGLWRRILHKVAKKWRFERMWNVFHAEYPMHSASASVGSPAEPPTLALERMEVDDGRAHRAVAVPAEQQPGPSAEGGLRAEATEFAPGLPMAEVVAAWNAAVEEAGRRRTLPTGERAEPTWLDLANELQWRAHSELMSRPSPPREETPWAPRPGNQAAAHASSSSDAGSSDYGYSAMWSD